MNHMTAVELLASAVKAELDQAPEMFNHPRTCVITGQVISEGYYARDIIPSSTSEFLDLLHGDPDGVMSIPAAQVYKSAWNMGSRLAFADGTCYHPLIDHKSATAQGRECWSDLVRTIWPARKGDQLVALITTDTKKRVWEKVRAGVLGPQTPVLVYNMERSVFSSLTLDWPEMLRCLDLVEEVYGAGFVKPTIYVSLFRQYDLACKHGLNQAIHWERQLRTWRHLPEFEFATLIAQKRRLSRETIYPIATNRPHADQPPRPGEH